MNDLTISHRKNTGTCRHCGADYPVSGGYIESDGRRRGAYVAGMHRCDGSQAKVLLTISITDESATASNTGQRPTCGVTLSVQADVAREAWAMNFMDSDNWPWVCFPFPGRRIGRREALSSPYKEWFFQAAEALVEQNPFLKPYLLDEQNP